MAFGFQFEAAGFENGIFIVLLKLTIGLHDTLSTLRKTSKPHVRTVHKTYKQLDRIVEVQIAMHRNLVTQARGVIIFPSKAIDLFALPLSRRRERDIL